MKVGELVLLALVLWTAIGVVGTVVALARREGERARRGVRWLALVWGVYLATELAVAGLQGQRVVAMGREQCFGEMCFTVAGVKEMPGFYGRNLPGDGTKLLRVEVRVVNRGKGRSQSEALIRAYLVDGQGRQWEELPGLSGVPLTTRVAAGATVVSEPVFKVAADASGLGLVFTHGRWQPGVLVVGDSDSLGHRRTVVGLGR